jgi:hypothetical protein
MYNILDSGDPLNPIWVIIDRPYTRDTDHGYILSCGYGYNFKKTWKLSQAPEPFITCVDPTIYSTNFQADLVNLIARLHVYHPPLIVLLGDELLNSLVPSTKQKDKKAKSLIKWAGSLLKSPLLNFDHYIIGSYSPDFVTLNWDLHEIQGYIDFGHVKEEYDYYKQHLVLQPLPSRTVITTPTYDTVCDYLRYLLDSYHNGSLSFVSSDIETLRPRKSTEFHRKGHSGYIYTISLAPSLKEAISFCLWDYLPEQAVIIFRLLSRVLHEIPQIGQNYFSFDSHHLEAVGFRVCLNTCQDTLIRHHVLWPGLPHKLQFQTRQYTRENYYKDEGKNWSSKHKHQLMRYNCLDAMVTYEIYLRQEEEFNARPHLR